MSQQLCLFPEDDFTTEANGNPPDELPDALTLLRDGAHLVLSISGGKDSDAMSHHLLDLHRIEGWTGDVCMVHADLQRMEWHNTPAYVRDFAKRKGVPLHVVTHNHGDIIDRIWQRYAQNPDRPCWPSSKIRYCTSDYKRAVISRWLRNTFPSNAIVVSAMGLRSQESPARAKRPTITLRKDSSAPTKGRFVYDWLPIHDWTEDDVWACIRQHGNEFHEAYKLGNERLSCALCVMGSTNDLLNGAMHNPDVYRELCRIEAVTGYSFRQNFWLSDIKPELLSQEILNAVARHRKI
jgi:3'-phosphoadenosine 5'-phosphosulfate sulfotransferase (PAPS reductase)/FAD synthetase